MAGTAQDPSLYRVPLGVVSVIYSPGAIRKMYVFHRARLMHVKFPGAWARPSVELFKIHEKEWPKKPLAWMKTVT